MDEIAEKYLTENFDVLMGGGTEVFSVEKRKDKKDMFEAFAQKGYAVVRNRDEMMQDSSTKPILGVFHEDGLPYTLDQKSSPELIKNIPTLAELTAKGIEKMKNHPNGFVMQVEGGKVDWAAHANDIGALIYDQIAFDEAVKVALDFADQNGETLVVITTDHGNANPGVSYGKEANNNFDRIQKFTQTNEWILNKINSDFTLNEVIELLEKTNNYKISIEDAESIFKYYHNLEKQEDGLYNYKKLPFKLLSDIQKKYTSVGWISDNHSADYVELAMYGVGKENLTPFMKNTDMHNFLLKVAGVDDLI